MRDEGGQILNKYEYYIDDLKNNRNFMSIISTEDGESRLKAIGASVLAIVIFILAYSGGRYLMSEGISAITSNRSEKATEKRVTNYFDDTGVWKSFSSTLGKFTVNFPIYPTHETQPLSFAGLNQSVNAEIYSAVQSDETTYMVEYMKYPEAVDVSIPENNLEGSVNGAVQGMGGVLISSKFINFGTYKAVESLIYKKEGGIYMKSRNILVGRNMYVIAVVYEAINESSVEYDKFVNSFQLQ